VITPFGLRHIGLVRALQGASIVLDPKSALLEEPSTPLQTALRGYFLRTSGAFTHVLRASDQGEAWRGFAQSQAFKPGLAWKVARMAPALDSSADAATMWYRLLLHVCIAAGERGVQRLLSCLPQDSPAEEVFRQASFALYCHEALFGCVSREEAVHGKLSARVRPLQPEDRWEVQRLYHRSTPRLVAQAEEMNGTASDTLPFTVPTLGSQQGYVLPGSNGQMAGYLHIASGSRGSWLRLLIPPDMRDGAAEMLDHALAVVSAAGPLRPDGIDTGSAVYCTVREYDGGIQSLLAERRFAPVSACSMLVKYTTVQVKAPQRKRVPALEKRAEVASSVSHSESGLAGKG